MMYFKLLFASLIMLTATIASAGKVVIFDAQQAIMQTDIAKKKMETLQKRSDYTKLRAEIEDLQSELTSLGKEAESKGLTWSAEKQVEHRKKAEFIQADLKLAVQKIQKENDDLVKGLLEEGQKSLPAILEQIVKTDDIDLILRKEAVFYADPVADITGKVIAELNKANKK